MSATATAPKRTTTQILRDLQALPFATLDRLMPKIIQLRTTRHPGVMSPREERLQKRIEAGVPRHLWDNFARLTEKRNAIGLTAREQQQIESIVERMEIYNVTWLEWVHELAGLRGLTAMELLKRLDISRPEYV